MYSKSTAEARVQLSEKVSFTSITDEKAFDASPTTYVAFHEQGFIMTVASCSPAQGKSQKSFATFKFDLPSPPSGKSLISCAFSTQTFISFYQKNFKLHIVSWIHHTRKMNRAKRYRNAPAFGEFILMRLPNSTCLWPRVVIEASTYSWCLSVNAS